MENLMFSHLMVINTTQKNNIIVYQRSQFYAIHIIDESLHHLGKSQYFFSSGIQIISPLGGINDQQNIYLATAPSIFKP